MRQRKHLGSVGVVSCAGDAVGLEQLEARRLLDADLGGVRFEFNDDGEAEISFWTGEHTTDSGGSAADPVRFKLTVDELRRAGANDFSGIEAVGWEEFVHFPEGRLSIVYPTGETLPYPFQVGAAFNVGGARNVGWALERNSGGSGVMSLLHELPTDVEISELVGQWNFVTLVLPVDGGPTSTEVMGAYGSVEILDGSGNFSYSYQTIDGSGDGEGVIQELAANGFGIVQTGEYFAVSPGKVAITAADLSFGDGQTYITIALKRGVALTATEVAGEYRFGSVVTGEAASRRGGGEVVFESLYLDLKSDGTLVGYDLEDYDLGTQTVVRTGRWTLLPEGRTVSVQYDGSGESHFYEIGRAHV